MEITLHETDNTDSHDIGMNQRYNENLPEYLQILGFSSQWHQFRNAWNAGKCHHAWMISGSKGIGKATFAKEIANAVLSRTNTHLPHDDTVEYHPESIMFDTPPLDLAGKDKVEVDASSPPLHQKTAQRIYSHPDFFLLTPDEGKKSQKLTIGIDDIRAFQKHVYLSSPDGNWKIVLVDSIDNLNSASAACLLKIVEEPPPCTLFFLISHVHGAVVPTLRSRCIQVCAEQLSWKDTCTIIKEKSSLSIADDDFAILYEIFGGSPGEILLFLEMYSPVFIKLILQLCFPSLGSSAQNRFNRKAVTSFISKNMSLDNSNSFAQLRKVFALIARHIAIACMKTTPNTQSLSQLQFEKIAEFLGKNRGEHSVLMNTTHLWAECFKETDACFADAIQLNLDKYQVILDAFLRIHAVSEKVKQTNSYEENAHAR